MKLNNKLGKSYSSFSGQDIRVIGNGHYIGNINSLSLNIQREKKGNYVVGEVDPISFGRGRRQISGVIKGLVLDTDFLSHKAFDGESALLDKDELFTLKDKRKETTTRIVTRPKYPNLGPPPVKMSQIEYFKKLYNPTMPNFGQTPDLEDALLSCIESAVENLLLGAAITIATGGLGSGLIASLLFDLITDCVGGVIVEGEI